MATTTIDTHDLTARLTGLRRSRPGLALRAARGDAGARAELGRVDADIHTCESDLEVLALAVEESRRLAAVEREAAAAEDRRRLEAEYGAREGARAAAYERVEVSLDELVGHARAAMDAALELDRLGPALGRNPATPPSMGTRGALATRIVGRLGADAGLRGAVQPVDGSRPLTGGAA